jgi:hypothetical protein
MRSLLLAFSERFTDALLPRVPPKRLHPRLYRLVAFGDGISFNPCPAKPTWLYKLAAVGDGMSLSLAGAVKCTA